MRRQFCRSARQFTAPWLTYCYNAPRQQPRLVQPLAAPVTPTHIRVGCKQKRQCSAAHTHGACPLASSCACLALPKDWGSETARSAVGNPNGVRRQPEPHAQLCGSTPHELAHSVSRNMCWLPQWLTALISNPHQERGPTGLWLAAPRTGLETQRRACQLTAPCVCPCQKRSA